jgi:hypothetical protein
MHFRELVSTDTLETVPQLEDFDAVDATLPHTPRPPSSRGGSITPRSGRKTPQKRVSYPGEDDMESTLIYDTEDAPSLSTGGGGSLKKHSKGKGKGKGKKSKDKSNKAEQKRK